MIIYEVGLSVDNQKGVVSVQDTSLETPSWENAVRFAIDLAHQENPNAQQVEFEFCKEYDT